jgi:hypothetical protein
MGNWIKNHWRPMMAMQYLAVCVFDFILAPVGWAIVQMYMHVPLVQWSPTTLSAGGLYHLAMGAVLGVAAWTRGQENIAKANKTE